jgi:RNA polymerase sigma-70 factor, ECF subfamily
MGLMALPEQCPGRTYETGALAFWHHRQDDGVAITDESLIQRIRSRDETALAILYHRHAQMVFSVVRSILTDEGDAEEIVSQIFYRIWLKAPDFKSAVSTVPEFLMVTARKCALDQFLHRGFENGGLLSADRNVPAFNVELMTRVMKIVADLPRSERAPVEIGNFEDANWARADRYAEQLIEVVKAKMRAALKTLRELPLGAPQSDEQRKQEES